TRTEKENLDALINEIQKERIDFAFLYWPGLDGLLHSVGNKSPEIGYKLAVYEQWLNQLFDCSRQNYTEVRLYILSDHGMANCDRRLDLKAKIDALPSRMGKDYAVVYDSTMARFWFFNDRARQHITVALDQIPEGRILSDSELANLGTLFADRYF